MKILVADDDAQLQRALRITLASRGYEVVAARDGAEAIDLAASAHPDLVLLDLGMPNVDGMDVIRAVRAWSNVPILVLSGRTDSAEKVEALDAGADDYVTKPFAMDELPASGRGPGRRTAPNRMPRRSRSATWSSTWRRRRSGGRAGPAAPGATGQEPATPATALRHPCA